MDIPNCNLTNSIGHLQDTCCLEECDHTSEETICEYECPKDMFLSQNILWDKNDGSLCRHGCRQTCPDNYDGARINDMCVECFILCRLEIRHTSCKCQNEKIENEESSLETKDYIIIALAITSCVLLVVLVVVACYWKWKWNKYNTKTIEDIEMHLKVNIYIYIAWFEDTKGIIRIRKSKEDKQMTPKSTKGRTTIYKTLHRKLMIEH